MSLVAFWAVATPLLALAGSPSTTDATTLNLAGAERMVGAARTLAERERWPVVIAVVDLGGHLLCLKRMDGAQVGSIDVAVGKAWTALAFQRPTHNLSELANQHPAVTTLSRDAVLLAGGLPVVRNGLVVGAIGVSGVTAAEDARIAHAGIEALPWK